jgi:hypothetical protein
MESSKTPRQSEVAHDALSILDLKLIRCIIVPDKIAIIAPEMPNRAGFAVSEDRGVTVL